MTRFRIISQVSSLHLFYLLQFTTLILGGGKVSKISGKCRDGLFSIYSTRIADNIYQISYLPYVLDGISLLYS